MPDTIAMPNLNIEAKVKIAANPAVISLKSAIPATPIPPVPNPAPPIVDETPVPLEPKAG